MANSKSKKRKKWIVLCLILLAVGGLAALAALRKNEPVISVQTEKVTRRSLTELVPANGRIQPVLQVKISPEVSGEIIDLPVKEGQKVKRGDLLLKIKPDFYAAAVTSSEASYNAALTDKTMGAANLAKAGAEYKRIEQLFLNKLVSESDFVSAKTTFDIAEASLEGAVQRIAMAVAALDRAKEDLRKTTITSPLDGTVTRLNSRLGERVVGTAMMAGTEIMTISDLNEMEAWVDIGEMDVVLIALGQQARLEVDAFKDRKFTGTVTEIANSSKGLGMSMGGGGQSQEATKFEVKIRIKDKEVFRPGMSVTSDIETRYRTNVLAVPFAAVTTRPPKEANAAKNPGKGKAADPKKKPGGTNSVKVAAKTNAPVAGATNAPACNTTNSPAGGGTNAPNAATSKKPGEKPKPIEVVFLKNGDRVKLIPVKRGISDENYMEITEGLLEGQEVVSGGYKAISRDLDDGKKVRAEPAKGEAAKEKK
jgi:HlyD family secretion protein